MRWCDIKDFIVLALIITFIWFSLAIVLSSYEIHVKTDCFDKHNAKIEGLVCSKEVVCARILGQFNYPECHNQELKGGQSEYKK